jgi:hypothetical protein
MLGEHAELLGEDFGQRGDLVLRPGEVLDG